MQNAFNILIREFSFIKSLQRIKLVLYFTILYFFQTTSLFNN